MAPVDSDLLRALEQLQDAADAVFGRITSRVGMERERLQDLSRRIQTVKVSIAFALEFFWIGGVLQANVDSISGSRQAITVLSSAKYPQVSSDAVDFKPLFGGHDEPLPVFKVELNMGNFQEDENEGTLELFRFFMETSHERLNVTPMHKFGSCGQDDADFNDRSIADVLPEHTKLPEQATSEASGKSTALYPPPQSLTQRNNPAAPGLEEYGFKPTLRQVPLFTLPSKIPDLPMVADISWTGSRTDVQELTSIVPSASNKSSQKLDAPKAEESRNPSQITVPPAPKMEEAPMPQLRPPQPPPRLISQNTKDDRGKSIIPPPPPPLPSPPMISSTMNPGAASKDKASASSSTPPQAIPPIEPNRAALLASIRSPNIKLRKTDVSEKTSEPTQEAEPPHSKQVADLLAEMASTLKMRRLSMKGATHGVPTLEQARPRDCKLESVPPTNFWQ
ncbi:hypothetical protein SELMODRAFT_402573 [Selaginella moellendorffii]|uniref:WH2 domain-containing protein n=1 Tax=Selaginella moellendorffii TaxID=88036 RepID=D8QR40_SELML|nr:hypothetical protein SELMODRAFT_402573 [Selaginella moellendorffii]